jgi:hypothetical protein
VTRGDRLVVAGVALIAALAWPVSYLSAAGGADSATVAGPQGRTVLSLRQDRTIDIAGVRGVVRLRVQDGSIRVVESACPNQICVHQGAISRPGAALVCVPNGVTVRIGGGGDGLDTVVR